MGTHAAAGKIWTKIELDELVVEDEFRLRGLEVTRLDTFIDAAFAFVLTILVISFDEIPSNYDELMAAVKRIPAFGFSFFFLMTYWQFHRRWSRCFGLENPKTILLSLSLIFVMLVYVYPIRIMLEAFFYEVSGGYLPSIFQIENNDELRGVMVFFAAGFFSMSIILNRLWRAAVIESDALALNEIELLRTQRAVRGWIVVASFAPISVLLALFLPDTWVPLAGYVYIIAFIIAGLLPRYLKWSNEQALGAN